MSDETPAMASSIDTKAVSQELVQELVNMVCKNDKFLALMKDLIENIMDKKIRALEQKMSVIDEKYDAMDNELKAVGIKLDTLDRVQSKDTANLGGNQSKIFERQHHNTCIIQDLQQHNKRNCVMITGIAESPRKTDPTTGKIIPEDTDSVVKKFLKDELEIELNEEDLDHAYRMPRPKKSNADVSKTKKPRAAVVTFTRKNVRNKVILSRTKLKGKHMGIQELLTKEKQQLLDQTKGVVKDFEKALAAWSWDGNIFLLISTGEGKSHRFIVRSDWDINNVVRTYCQRE
jgi:hypothetical protein